MNWRARIQINTAAYALALLLGLCAVGFAGFAGYLALDERFESDCAALLTAAGFIIMALVIIGLAKLITWYSQYRRSRRKSRRRRQPLDELEQVLQNGVDPAIADWVRRNPGSALVATLLAGVVAGYSDNARGVFKDLYSRYFGQEHTED